MPLDPAPVIGSRSRARHARGSSPPNMILWPRPWWRTTSLRVGARVARRTCQPGLGRGGGRSRRGGLVSSGGRTAPPDILRHRPDTERTCLACRADSIHIATPDTTKQSCMCRVWRVTCVNWTIAILTCSINDSLQFSGIQFTRPKRTRHRQDSFVASGVAV